jgi:lipoyl(octanoyl) transferase
VLCQVQQLGLVTYGEGLRLQQELVAERKAGSIPDTLLLLEHPHVYTLGRNARRANMLVSDDFLAQIGAGLVETDRGGDITYHGPGQLVGYPIFDLTKHKRDIAWYMRSLEEVFIRVARDYGVTADRVAGAAGVWVGNEKLVAMGVHISRWVTSHGFAFNVSPDLKYFDYIVPCGLKDKGVTSLERLLGRKIPIDEAMGCTIAHFGEVFALDMQAAAVVDPRR